MGRAICIVLAMIAFAASPVRAERRVALVMGVSNYRSVNPLANPANDARVLARSLRETGFEVTEVADPDFAQFGAALSAFRQRVVGADVAIVYYAGHGVEVNGVNWLLPISVQASTPEDLQFEAVRSSALVDVVRQASKIRLVILDACRDNPFVAKRGWTGSGRGVAKRGLAREDDGTDNVVILMATQAGQTAADGQGQPNSPFAMSLSRLIKEPGLRLGSLPGRMSKDVRKTTGYDQSPDQQGIFDEPDWMFVPGASTVAAPPARAAPANAGPDLEIATWELCSRSQTASPCEKYRQKYPGGRFAELAVDRIQDLNSSLRGAVTAQPPPARSTRPEMVIPLGVVVSRDSSGAIVVGTVQPDSPAMGQLFGGDVIVQINSVAPDLTLTPGQALEAAIAASGRVKLLVQRGPTTTMVILRAQR